ncbi:M13 family metallopeptidase [Xylanibacter muris]|uniref:M13 family metallopeptidase n=1 Tax=Xylanibacter muris TaxID=2736290 RepID=A0ABX2ASI6_9BACT|nr:M13 family metallopeptidase [Xylanibacter muris]NPD93164.1 M13 family metallopeptidase [Xylanibacter muris]
MRMKRLFPIMAFASMSVIGMAQGQLKSGINLANLNQTVNPSEDFFEFACGGWMKNNPLPAAYSRYGTFDQLGEGNNKRINSILSELKTKTYTKGSTEQKLSDLYKLAMDSVKRNNDGVKPLMGIINRMEKAKTVKALFDIQLELTPQGDNEFIGTYIGSDDKNASQNILNIVQSGITLGQKDYYLDNDSATTAIREAYRKHIVRMFQMFGFGKKASEQKMNNIMKLETELAKVSKSRTELRDPEANYHKMTIKDFETKYPHIQLTKIALANGIKPAHIQEIVVGQPEFVAGADKIIANITAAEYRDYMEWGQIMSAAGYLSDDIVEANFDFFGKTMSGRKQNHPLWKRATSQVESQMGQALGKIYVEKYFPASSKERMKKLVRNLQIALGERIKAQDWMGDATKKNALEKLNSFYVKIGYPDKWTDMTELNIDPSKSYYENIVACRKFWNKWTVDNKSGKPVDREEWYMNPQTVNAYYNPTTNEICFPAGILQIPFFDPQADDAFNYGAIGVVIGHEMTHGFDDQGRHYDKNGNMHDWWTEEDGNKFNKRADLYADFFSNINVLPDLKANGRFTLGENLADHGGLQVAYHALKNATKDAPLGVIDGFTPEQRFFLAYSGVWAANITEEEIRNRTKSDPHSLGRWRVNGALPHIDMWYDAFNVKDTDKMFIPKSQRLELW